MRRSDPAFAAALASVVLACATPPPPEDSSSSGLALHLDARAPVRILPAEVDQVLFVRLDESRENPLLGTSVFYSNYSDDGYFYLLNPPPGRYVAVAAVGTKTAPPPAEPQPAMVDLGDGVEVPRMPDFEDQPSFILAIYFSEDLVRQTEATARPGGLSFMGEFLVHTSPLRGADPVQSHYLRLLQPGESGNAAVQLILHSSGIYAGRAAAVERGDAARERFSGKASEHLTSAGWGPMLGDVAGGPPP